MQQSRKVNLLKCLTLHCEKVCRLLGTNNFIKEARYCTTCYNLKVMPIIEQNSELIQYTTEAYNKFMRKFKSNLIIAN